MLVLAPLALGALAPLPQEETPPKAVPVTEEQVADDEVAPHLRGSNEALRNALAWLATFQDDDGRWDSAGFAKHATLDVEGGAEGVAGWKAGKGDPRHSIGVTGLALLALMADGNTRTDGLHSDQVARGLDWLRLIQDEDTGLFGEAVGHAFMYDHGIATLALVEALAFEKSPRSREAAQLAMHFISRARNPYGVWRYEVPPNGDNDTSVTTWMVMALDTAQRAGLKVDREGRVSALAWFDQMTDPGTGRVGYTEMGSPSSRVPGMNEWFNTGFTETLTAAALLCRLTLGQEPEQTPVLTKHIRLIVQTVPRESPVIIEDALWIFYGTRAIARLGDRPWQIWSETYIPTLVTSQSKEGPGAGSWNPNSAWGFSMGRVGTTALMAWTLATVKDRER